ncbi:MAG: hypothetical protein HXX17_10220 [Geobacteraceae bacterium]|nr:hypothetical protein [Geobacteraceae bacterium]
MSVNWGSVQKGGKGKRVCNVFLVRETRKGLLNFNYFHNRMILMGDWCSKD